MKPFSLLVKPSSADCNLRCRYCFYLDRCELYPETSTHRMSDEVLETFIRQYIEDQNCKEIVFSWQGGEPTLLGLDFFKKVVELEKKYCPAHKRIENDLQTNGTLLDDEWCEFLAENDFLVGLSIDGPQDLHDAYRKDKLGQGSFDVYTFMKTLHDLGFKGPVGLQCYAVKGDKYENLKQSMAAWKDISARIGAK